MELPTHASTARRRRRQRGWCGKIGGSCPASVLIRAISAKLRGFAAGDFADRTPVFALAVESERSISTKRVVLSKNGKPPRGTERLGKRSIRSEVASAGAHCSGGKLEGKRSLAGTDGQTRGSGQTRGRLRNGGFASTYP